MLLIFSGYCGYDIAIFRRYRSGKPIDQPDRLHFHQLVIRALELTLLSPAERPDQSIGYIDYRAIGLSADRGDDVAMITWRRLDLLRRHFYLLSPITWV